jgi:predicted PurR-regulated permease PerM
MATNTRRKAGSEQQAPIPIDSQARRASRIALTIGLVIIGLWIAQEFLAPLGWAVIIVLTTWPAYQIFAKSLADRTPILAPLSFTVIIGVVLFIPVAVALYQAAEESHTISQHLAHARQHGIPAPSWLHHIPFGEQAASWWTTNLSDPNGAVQWLGAPPDRKADAAWSRSLGSEVLRRFFHFVIALVGIFVLLRDGAWIGNRVLETADRLLGDPGERLASKMAETIRGVVNGTVVVAVAEGLIIGLAYVVAGVPNPLLFAFLTMAFAMVPFGAWLVFTGASLLLVSYGGSALAAAGIFGFGAVVMIVGDIFAWPALVGNQARLPFLLTLIGIFGGLQVFGLIGLFLGPMFLAGIWIVWREWIAPGGKGETAKQDV